jgi:hypothetical protein
MNFPVARCRCDAHTCHCACMLTCLLPRLRERSKNKIVVEFSLLQVHHWRSHEIGRYGSVCVYDTKKVCVALHQFGQKCHRRLMAEELKGKVHSAA